MSTASTNVAEGFWSRVVEPLIIDLALGNAMIARRRAQLLGGGLAGRVLEIGSGTGQNFRHYPSGVDVVYALEPSAAMARRAEKRRTAARVAIEPLAAGAEAIPLADGSVDAAVSFMTLCSIPPVEAALAEVRRVLKPGGRLLFLEHGRAPDPGVRKWQDRLQPIHGALFGGCRVDRDVPALLAAAGFTIESIDAAYQPWSPKYASWIWQGAASR